jgi:hypothetical protein
VRDIPLNLLEVIVVAEVCIHKIEEMPLIGGQGCGKKGLKDVTKVHSTMEGDPMHLRIQA